MKKLVFRIRRQYFDAIVDGTKTVEYRRYIDFWLVRLGLRAYGLPLFRRYPGKAEFEAVFICGKRSHYREILYVERIVTPDSFSEQGKRDVDTPTCLAFYLGDVIQNE